MDIPGLDPEEEDLALITEPRLRKRVQNRLSQRKHSEDFTNPIRALLHFNFCLLFERKLTFQISHRAKIARTERYSTLFL